MKMDSNYMLLRDNQDSFMESGYICGKEYINYFIDNMENIFDMRKIGGMDEKSEGNIDIMASINPRIISKFWKYFYNYCGNGEQKYNAALKKYPYYKNLMQYVIWKMANREDIKNFICNTGIE